MSLATLLPSARSLGALDVSVLTEGTRTVLTLRGDADMATLPTLEAVLIRVVADHHGDVVVDLAETAFIDTATLRAVLGARDALEGTGRRLTFRSPSRNAGRLLEIFGLSKLVTPPRHTNGTEG